MGGMKKLILLLIFEVVYISVNGVAFICFIKLCSFCIFLFEILVKIFSSTRVNCEPKSTLYLCFQNPCV